MPVPNGTVNRMAQSSIQSTPSSPQLPVPAPPADMAAMVAMQQLLLQQQEIQIRAAVDLPSIAHISGLAKSTIEATLSSMTQLADHHQRFKQQQGEYLNDEYYFRVSYEES